MLITVFSLVEIDSDTCCVKFHSVLSPLLSKKRIMYSVSDLTTNTRPLVVSCRPQASRYIAGMFHQLFKFTVRRSVTFLFFSTTASSDLNYHSYSHQTVNIINSVRQVYAKQKYTRQAISITQLIKVMYCCKLFENIIVISVKQCS